MELQTELVKLLAEAKFNLRKWSSNCTTLMDSIPTEDYAYQIGTTQSKKVKCLVLVWNPDSDQLSTCPKSITVITLSAL